jgi:hypothetical protein
MKMKRIAAQIKFKKILTHPWESVASVTEQQRHR